MGGSFDHFHEGHRHFLSQAAALADQLVIGVTNDAMIQTKAYSWALEPLAARLASVTNFCERLGIKFQTRILNDIYGPTLEPDSPPAVLVTPDTLAGGEMINRVRASRQLPTLTLELADFWQDELGQALHSERIRQGQVSRQGQVYTRIFETNLTLTPTQRDHFSQPQGHLVDLAIFHPQTDTPIIVVGDQSLETFITRGWPYHLGIYDHYRLRQPATSSVIDGLTATETVTNPAGKILQAPVKILEKLLLNWETLPQLQDLAHQPLHLEVAGEEDLLAVALILLVPLGTHIYYGQPGAGIVDMVATESLKHNVFSVLSH